MRSGTRELFPPSLFVSVELCMQIYSELLENLADLGFRLCVAFGGHGPAASLLKELADNLGGRIDDMAIFTCGSGTFIRDEIKEDGGDDPSPLSHGGKWETAMNMALNADHVDLSRVRSIDDSPIPSQLKGRPSAHLSAIEASSVEFGELLLSTAASRLAAEVRELMAEGV